LRIAFYAPMKPPTHPVPSGDRAVARLLMQALTASGHEVQLASGFRSWEGRGDPCEQARLRTLGEQLAVRLVNRYRQLPANDRPELWFTYHVYHKAPDWLGPVVSGELDIPYVIAEPSFARKQAHGPWRRGHQAAAWAIGAADALIALNARDVPGVQPLRKASARMVRWLPFLDTARYDASRGRLRYRDALARRYRADPRTPWLLCVAMMRPGDKLASFRLLAAALEQMTDRPWTLFAVGDGPASGEVFAAFDRALRERVVWAGKQAPESTLSFYWACDLFVWPALNEAYGMALLEAQAASLPAVVGRGGGVADLIRHGQGGLMVRAGDVGAFARAVNHCLTSPTELATMGELARVRARRCHDLHSAARALDALLSHLVARGPG
jgi:glycosyltransferase involved in cell wall biosynthesis